MKKILFVITKSNWGGAQRYVYDIASSLPTQTWNVRVVLGGTGLPGAPIGRLAEELHRKDIRTLFIPTFMRGVSLGAEVRAFKNLWGLFATENPDIVHLNSSKAGGLGSLAARLAGVPHIVFTVHGLPWEEDRNVFSRFAIRLMSWCTFLLSHRVIVISNHALAHVRSFPFCKNKVRLVHNGVAPIEFLSREDARAQLQIPTDIFCIGAIGELTWNKGYHTLLRAAGTLKRRGKKFVLCIAGEGEERKFIETIRTEEKLGDTVTLAGFVLDAYRTLAAFDLFVLPSLKEGLPYVLIEAGLAGRAVVASLVGGVPDIIEHRITGLLVGYKNHGELTDALMELIDKPLLRKKYGDALYEHTKKEFSLSHMLEKTIAVYNE
jgi:glycosyltransferase involved in cell wall biosynthesis